MKLKFFSILALTGLCAFGAMADDFSGSLYIQDASIAPGGTAKLSIQLDNNIGICGFDFKMILPEGISFITWGVNPDRLPSGATTSHFVPRQSFENQTLSVSGILNYTPTGETRVLPFTGNEGEVATITIEAAQDIPEGDYVIELTNINVSDQGGSDHKIANTTFTLSVKKIEYAEGYAVKVLPFALNENKVDERLIAHIPITMVNNTNVKTFEFELQLPSSFIESFSYYDGDGIKISLTGFTSTIGQASADGTISVTAAPSRPTYKINAGTTNIGEIPLYYENDLIPTGVYPINIKNIKLTDTEGKTYYAAPYTTEIFVGENPKIEPTDGVAAFHGDYGEAECFELLKAALPVGATIDLTEVSAMAEDPTGLRTDNVIATTETISYGRAMSNKWGSLCLPFAVNSDDNIQLYELKSVSSTAMTFDPVGSADANTPVIFKKLSDDGFSVATDNDGEFNIGFAAETPTLTLEAIEDWDLHGSYIEETIDVSGMQAYGLINNEFHRFTESLTAGAFRAWLQNNGAPMNATFRIDDSTEGISIVEQEDGSVKLIFDMQGRQLKDSPSQQIIIENGQKKFNK